MNRARAPNSLRDRSALLGVTPPASGRSSPLGEPGGQRFVDDLEGQNDELVEGLSAKVKLLKDVSLDLTLLFPLLTSFLSFLHPGTDHRWDRQRSAGIDGPTQPNGATLSILPVKKPRIHDVDFFFIFCRTMPLRKRREYSRAPSAG